MYKYFYSKVKNIKTTSKDISLKGIAFIIDNNNNKLSILIY